MSQRRFYATCQAPNGTHDLLICDDDGTIQHSIPDALFGAPDRKFQPEDDGYSWCDGDSVSYRSASKDIEEHGELDGFGMCAYLTASDVRRYVAASPVQDPDDILREAGLETPAP